MQMIIARAADTLLRGGVIAYPTEGIYGLGCLPDNEDALRRLLRIKQRDPAKGLILIVSGAAQLEGWADLPDGEQIPAPNPAHPVTWLVPAHCSVPTLVTGNHAGLAIRITTNRTAAAICDAIASPLVSTSANIAGQATARNRITLRRQFDGLVDYIVPGDCGPASGSSAIRDLITGRTTRP